MSQSSTPPATRRQLRDRGDASISAEDGKKRAASGEKTDKEKAGSTPVSSSLVAGAKMRTRLSTGTLFMSGTSTTKEKDVKVTLAEDGRQQKEVLSTAAKRKAPTLPLESSPPIPPKRQKIGRNDGSGEGNRNDYFCWLCHKEGSAAYCVLCPRVYHLKCLDVTTLPDEWVCPECEKTMRAECADTRSKAMSLISIDTLCLLLRYALDRMKQPGSEAFESPVDQDAFPNYSDYVFYPMDFSTLEKNIKKKEYGCTEAFLADAKWILHNCVAFNGVHHKLTSVARNIIKCCRHEMSEIEVCPECYQNSCIKGETSWFIEPCHPPHPLVWAKLKGYPFWPGKVLRDVSGQLDVRFFGAHDRSWVPVSQVFLLSKESPVPIRNNKGGYGAAMVELKQHIKNIRDKFGAFMYPPARTPYEKQHVFIDAIRKASNGPLSKRLKLGVVGKIPAKIKDSWGASDKVSVVSKTASALKTKYSSMATKKGMVTAQSRGQTAVHSASEDHDPSSSVASQHQAQAVKKPTSDILSHRVCKVSVTDIIQQKISKIEALEAEEVGESMEVVQGNEKDPEEEKEVVERGEEDVKEEEKVLTKEGRNDVANTDCVKEEEIVEGVDKEHEKAEEIQAEAGRAGVVYSTGSWEETSSVDVSQETERPVTSISSPSFRPAQSETAVPGTVSEADCNTEVTGAVSSEQESGVSSCMNRPAGCQMAATKESVSQGDEGEGTVTKESSPKSSEYRDSLTKTIEACKGKLGITSVKEESEDDIIGIDCESDMETADDSKLNETETGSENKDVSSSDTGSDCKVTLSSQGKESTEPRQPAKPTPSTVAVSQSDPSNSLQELPGSQSEKSMRSENSGKLVGCGDHKSKQKQAEMEKESSQETQTSKRIPSVEEESVLRSPYPDGGSGDGFTVIKPVAKQKVNGDATQESSSGLSEPVLDSEKLHSGVDKVCGQSAGPETSVAEEASKPSETVGKTPDNVHGKAPSESDARKSDKSAAEVSGEPSKSVSVIDKNRQASSDGVIVKSTCDHRAEENLSSKIDSSRLQPIIVGRDDDQDEPSLLMEVETEAEHDQLIIDLEEDDLDLREIGSPGRTGQSGRSSGSSGFMKQLSPSPGIVRDIQEVRKAARKSDRRLARKMNTSAPVSTVLSVDTTSAIPPRPSIQSAPDPAGSESARPSSFVPFRIPASPPELPQNSPVHLPPPSGDADPPSSSTTTATATAVSKGETNLSPAIVKLVNSFSSEMQVQMQQKLAEMCRQVLTVVQPEQDKSRCYQQEMDRLKWIHQQEVAEIKHNYKLTIAEMKAIWEAEKSKSVADLKKRLQSLTKEKEEAIVATKKKQWCAFCWKEAIYYCCWNTSYCSYQCQQQHWPSHLPDCTQAQPTTTAAAAAAAASTIATAVSARPVAAMEVPAGTESDVMVMASSCGQGGGDSKAGEKEERIKAQKFNIPPPSSSAAITAAGDAAWRSQLPLAQQALGQNIQFMPLPPSQRAAPPPQPTQPLQPLQYLQSLGSGPTLFQSSSQVQLLAPRPGLPAVLPPGTVMPPNTAVFPILRPTQPSVTPGSQNILTRPMQYQPIWK